MSSRVCASQVAVLVVGLVAGLATPSARADLIVFAPGDYDNTANTVTGSNVAPVYNNNQTTGVFRDVFWWGTAYNGGVAGVGSPDFINSGQNMISDGGSPARARPLGNDTALNFTGQRTGGILFPGASFLTVYDTTPGDGAATRNLFDATGGLTISADVLFGVDGHAVGAGVVALYSEGQDGLALLAHNGGGNNPDVPSVSLVFQQRGVPTTLTSASLTGLTTFRGDTVGGLTSPNDVQGDNWYRVLMSLEVSGDSYTVNGSFYNHTDPTNPNSALGALITTLNWSGSLSSPGNMLDLTNPGEIGLMAYTRENFNDGLGNGGTGADPRTDNIGVSISNFSFPSTVVVVPESATLLSALVLLPVALMAVRRRRKA